MSVYQINLDQTELVMLDEDTQAMAARVQALQELIHAPGPVSAQDVFQKLDGLESYVTRAKTNRL